MCLLCISLHIYFNDLYTGHFPHICVKDVHAAYISLYIYPKDVFAEYLPAHLY